MSTRKMLVIEVEASIAYHAEKDLVAARVKELGLTAYGRTEDDAVSKLAGLLDKFIEAHNRSGRLPARLDKAGVPWKWKDEGGDESWHPAPQTKAIEQLVAVV